MRDRFSRFLPLLVLALLVLPFPTALPAGKKAPGKTAHPPVEATDTCDGCHAELSPEVHQAWFESKHGLLGVKCFVCHGSAGSDFALKAPPSRCVGCHGEKVEALKTPFFKGKDCFSCHSGHTLNPHKKVGK